MAIQPSGLAFRNPVGGGRFPMFLKSNSLLDKWSAASLNSLVHSAGSHLGFLSVELGVGHAHQFFKHFSDSNRQ